MVGCDDVEVFILGFGVDWEVCRDGFCFFVGSYDVVENVLVDEVVECME